MTDKDHTEPTTGDPETPGVEVTESAGVEVTEAGDDTEATEAADASAPAAPLRPPTKRSGIGGVVGLIAVAAALLISAGLCASVYFLQYRPDQQTEAEAANVALEAAKNGTVALLSYSPDSLEKDFANAKSNLTGDFLNYYTQFTEQIVTPAAKEKQVKTSASVVRAAVSEFHPDSANVLVFVNQVTMSKENPDGAFAASSVKVGLKKIDGRWLIDAFDPV